MMKYVISMTTGTGWWIVDGALVWDQTTTWNITFEI